MAKEYKMRDIIWEDYDDADEENMIKEMVENSVEPGWEFINSNTVPNNADEIQPLWDVGCWDMAYWDQIPEGVSKKIRYYFERDIGIVPGPVPA